jgi:diguanylate cyclase (GGDEF)-like protein
MSSSLPIATPELASVGLSPQLLQVAFPFVLGFDQEMVTRLTGPAFRRISPEAAPAVRLTRLVELVSPSVEFTFAAMAARPRSSIVLRLREERDRGLLLRGQVVIDERSGLALFLGSPWVHDPEQLIERGLSIGDFPPHDGQLDRIVLLQAQEMARQDSRRLQRRQDEELDAVPDLVLRLASDATVLAVHPATQGHLALDPAQHVGGTVYDLFPTMRQAVHDSLAAPRRTGAALSFDYDVGDGATSLRLEARATRTESGSLVLVRDITEQSAKTARLRAQAEQDPLTGLAVRPSFLASVAQALDGGDRGPGHACVLAIDLDDFQRINSRLGPSVGDRLLQGLAERLRRCLRPADVLSRLGGNAFGVLLDGVDVNVGTAVAQRVLTLLSEPFTIDGPEPLAVLSGSVGVASSTAGNEAADLLRNAEIALKTAKSEGKGCHAVFAEAMHTALRAEVYAEVALRAALDHDEFVLRYQPIVRMDTGAIVGAEALVRWQHPERGLLGPGEFIGAAEHSGLIVELGARLLRLACQAAAGWSIGVSVNVSARQLSQGGLVGTVAAALAASGLPPERLTLEITETALLKPCDQTTQTLQRVHDSGVRLALDDFGTGYSSLSHLRLFPIDLIKIDKSFVDEVCNPDKSRLPQAIVALGQALNLDVVAEGVETPEQADALRGMDCPRAQGYLFSRPVTPEAVTALLATQSGGRAAGV